MRGQALVCSFCGRDHTAVNKLVAGPRVFICDRCAYETVRIMETAPDGPAPGAPAPLWRRIVAWMRSAGGRRSDTTRIAQPGQAPA